MRMNLLMRLGATALALLGAACGSSDEVVRASVLAPADGWVGTWAAAPYGPFPLGPLNGTLPVDPVPLTTLFPGDQAHDQSFRMVVHPTLGGPQLRVRLSNLMGDRPIRFEPVRVARRALGPALVPGSERAVSFDGADGVTVAPGQEALSDAVDLAVAVGDDLAVSFHVAGDSGPMTWHAVSLNLNYVGLPGSGDTTADPVGLSFAQVSVGWFFLSGIDVLRPDALGTVVAIGDSITDGTYQLPETNTRWPDFLAQRLRAQGIVVGVLNQGINSNTVTAEASPPGSEARGPAAVMRFERDVLSRPGVRSVIIFEGTNDLPTGVKAADIYAGIRSMVDRAHAAGLCAVVGTIMPRADLIFGWSPSLEPERLALNELLRADPSFDGIADFDAAMRSPLDPGQPNLLYYAPDLLHPTSIGFAVMADAVPLEALVPPPAGRCVRAPGSGA